MAMKLSNEQWNLALETIKTRFLELENENKAMQAVLDENAKFRAQVSDYERRLNEAGLLTHKIDLASTPKVPNGLRGVATDEHQIKSRATGVLEIKSVDDVRKLVNLHLDEGQMDSRIVGHKLKKKLEGKQVYSAVLLDFLLEHPQFIPDEWKTKGVIYFWGTIYRDSGDNLYVRYLRWSGGGWYSDCYWLDCGWDDNEPSACRAEA